MRELAPRRRNRESSSRGFPDGMSGLGSGLSAANVRSISRRVQRHEPEIVKREVLYVCPYCDV